jgi:plasmid stabilization system protein ParE
VDDTQALKLRYTPTARSDIKRILDHTSDQSPQTRISLEIQFQTVFDLLCNYPFAGTVTSRARLRRRVVAGYPYVVFYRVQLSTLLIVAVRHTARRPRRP